MNLFKKIPWQFEEKEYEIRVLYDDTAINVVAFLNNHPANGYRHQVKLPQKCDVQALLGKYPADELIETSKKDISEKRWEKISKMTHEPMEDNG